MHRNIIGEMLALSLWVFWSFDDLRAQKERPPRAAVSLRNPISLFCQADAFRFLRQPNKPNAPRPLAKSGRAAGSGVVETEPKSTLPVGYNSMSAVPGVPISISPVERPEVNSL
jgi:hypothetical protein